MHSASASSPLPHHVDAVKLCQQGGRLSGSTSLAQLHRLGEQLCHQNGQAQVDWQFSLDEQSRKVIHGTVTAILPLVCQRCLEQVDVAVQADTNLALVWSDEQAAQLSRSLDPMLMETDVLDVLAAVEDELLLALPIVATHETGACEVAQQIENPQAEESVEEKSPNPFQVLANLKTDGNKTP